MAFRSNNNNNNNSTSNYQSQRRRYNNFGDRYSTNNFDNGHNQQIRPTRGRGGGGFIRTNRGYGHTPNKNLQVNASRFGRPTPTNNTNTNKKHPRNSTRGNGRGIPIARQYYGRHAPQQTYGDADEPIENEYEFPNDWVKQYESTAQPLETRDNYYGWKATRPLARYHTRSNGKLYPDRRGIPQIAKKGEIEEIIRDGCQFVVDHYKTHSSLLPSSITLMLFRPNSRHRDQSGSQIRLHYSWLNFFKILWINAKRKTGFGIEIPSTGWKLSSIEKFEDSLKRNVAGTLAIALYKNQIDESNECCRNLIGPFSKLSPDFCDYLSQKKEELNSQDVAYSTKDIIQWRNNNDDTKDKEATGGDDEKIDDGLKRNAREAMKYFKDNDFNLSDDEPRFIKKIDGDLESYICNQLAQELSNCFEMAKQLSSITDYEWRINLVLDDDNPYLAMEPWSETRNNPFEVYTDLKQMLANDQEGDDTKEDVKIEFIQSYFHKMAKVYRDWKKSLFELFVDDNDWIEHKKLLKKLQFKIARVYYIDQVDGPGERGSIFDGDWMKCCVEYKYPGKEILDKIDVENDATSDGTDDHETNECVEHIVNDESTGGDNVRQCNNDQKANYPERELVNVTNGNVDTINEKIDFIAQTADDKIIATDGSQNNVAADFEADKDIDADAELQPLDQKIMSELQGIVNKSFLQSPNAPKINDKTHIDKCAVSCPGGNNKTGGAASSFGNANSNSSNYQNNRNTNNNASNWNNNGWNNGNGGNGGNGNGNTNPVAPDISRPVLKCPLCSWLYQYGDPAFAAHMQMVHNLSMPQAPYSSQPQSLPTSWQSPPIHPNQYSSPMIRSNSPPQAPSTPPKSQSNKPVCPKTQFEPNTEIRARKNIFIPPAFTAELRHRASVDFKTKCYINHKKSDCKCDPAYSWIDNDVAMQFENDANQINANRKIFNSGIPDKMTENSLFYVVEIPKDDERSDETMSDGKSKKVVNKYPWQMRDKLYGKQEICDMFDLKESELPPPVRNSNNFLNQMKQFKFIRQSLNDKNELNYFIEKTKWCKVQVFSKLDKQRRRTLSITKIEFIRDLKSDNDFEDINLIPILIFENNKYKVQQLMVVKIDGISVGISMVWNDKQKRIKVKGIYFDKSMILKQHQWIRLEHLKSCRCLDNFDTQRMNHLAIGNPDDAENQIKRLKKQLENRSPTSSSVRSMSVSVSPSGSSKGSGASYY